MPPEMGTMGNKFGKPDLERVGLFAEMPYLSAKSKPKPKFTPSKPNFYASGSKTKNGTQHGYFDDTFKRVFSKEAIKGRGRKMPPSKVKNVSERPFMPPTGSKWHATPGDYFGCFSGTIAAFSAKPKPKPPYQKEPPNCITGPGRKGGPGYVNICLNPYPEHFPDRYGLKAKYKEYGKTLGGPMVSVHYPKPFFDLNPYQEGAGGAKGPTYVRPKDKPVKIIGPGYIVPTGPAKWDGGCHAGTFHKFPQHMPEKYQPTNKKKNKDEKIFVPPSSALKSFYCTSVLNQNIDFRVNKDNYESFAPTYVKHLLNIND